MEPDSGLAGGIAPVLDWVQHGPEGPTMWLEGIMDPVLLLAIGVEALTRRAYGHLRLVLRPFLGKRNPFLPTLLHALVTFHLGVPLMIP